MTRAGHAMRRAMHAFAIPAGHEDFIYALPAILVAKADGIMSMEEVFEILCAGYAALHLQTDNDEEHVFERFVLDTVRRSVPMDASLVLDAVKARLASLPSDEADRIRAWMLRVCRRVARAHGESFFKRTSPDERRMLDALFGE